MHLEATLLLRVTIQSKANAIPYRMFFTCHIQKLYEVLVFSSAEINLLFLRTGPHRGTAILSCPVLI